MYYLGADGKRVYTLKVCFLPLGIYMCALCMRMAMLTLSTLRSCVSVNALQKEDPSGKPTHSAHPARFSPDDKFSKERIITKKRFGLLPTQTPDPIFN